ncbi:hypothetical protein LUZ61_007284 [Rhynchospora tenuis]|uniref:Uncharacterized protein n=1 Tax=Rhynchospora tenuis TaxID=198213 RepID=A0AAD5ZT38_9POAL|nr:hypothetical protein LUZ61_007284 [Rhynchospora tenuis]
MGTYELDTEVVVAQPSKAEAEEKTAPEMGLTEDEELLLQIPLVATAILPLTLKAVVGLGIIEILNKGSVPHIAGTLPVMMTAEDIAAQLPTKNPQAATMLDRMLGLLASFNIVRCAIEKKEKVVRRYGPAPFFKWLAKNEHGALAANFVHLGMEQAFFSAGQHLQEAVLEGGIPFEKAHGMTSFQYMATDLKLSSVFNKAMKHNTILIVNKMLETYQGFKDAHVLVDVGGGVGTSLGMIVSKYPHIKGINFDLPHAIAEAAPLPGVEHISGDMFDSIPHGDAILLKVLM